MKLLNLILIIWVLYVAIQLFKADLEAVEGLREYLQ